MILKREKLSIRTKLSLLLVILGFLNLAFLPIYGFIPGFLLISVGFVLARESVIANKSDLFAEIAYYFAIGGLLFLLFIVGMFFYLRF